MSEKLKKQEIRSSMERVSAQCCCIPYTVIEIFDCNCNDLGHPRFVHVACDQGCHLNELADMGIFMAVNGNLIRQFDGNEIENEQQWEWEWEYELLHWNAKEFES